MSVSKRIEKYMKESFTEVLQTTLNPDGPGAVRIHLIPPEITDSGKVSSVAIINGQDIVPVNYSWTILLAELIRHINSYDGRPLSERDLNDVLTKTIKGVRKVFPLLSSKLIKNDVYTMFNTFEKIAKGEPLEDVDIEYLSIGEYAPFMKAPHRMDLMVSAMTKNGQWHCNQKCVHCYAAGQPNAEEKELSTEDWKRILDKCRENTISQVTFTGGEPTMREDLFELISYARWFVSRLNTNGIKLTEEYCMELKRAELDSLQITFYSHERDVHNKLVGAPQYDNTLSGIKNAISCGLSLSINTPLCTLNRDYVNTLQFLHDLGVTYVTCSGLITTGNALTEESEGLQLTDDEIREILEEAICFCNNHGMEINFTSPGWIENQFFAEHGIPSPNCGACLSNMAITPGGNVVPCQSWLSSDALGNILTDSWNSIWNNDISVKRRAYSQEMLGKCPLRVEGHKGGDC